MYMLLDLQNISFRLQLSIQFVSTKPQFKPRVVGIAIILSLIFFSFNFEPRLRHLTLVIYRFERWADEPDDDLYMYVGSTYNIIQNDDIDEIVYFVCLDSVATKLSVLLQFIIAKDELQKNWFTYM